jgi:uncharacterized protein YqcC (DUF446 family)
MQSNHRERALLAVVDGLEVELRRMQLWDSEPPSERKLASSQPFCIDTLAFPQWLQWLLIPKMRSVLAGECPMPTQSAIYPLAVDCFEHLEDPCALLTLIERFDQLIRDEIAATVH